MYSSPLKKFDRFPPKEQNDFGTSIAKDMEIFSKNLRGHELNFSQQTTKGACSHEIILSAKQTSN